MLSTEKSFFLLSRISLVLLLWSGSGVTTVHGPPRPHAVASAPVVLVRLRLALGSLWFGVGGHGWFRLLHRHGSPQVCALAQEVRLRWEAERALPEHHAHWRALLWPRSVAKLQRGQVYGVALTQKLPKKEEESRGENSNQIRTIFSQRVSVNRSKITTSFIIPHINQSIHPFIQFLWLFNPY